MNYTSLDQALNSKLDLVERIQSIDLQLAENELSMSEADYAMWRIRALRAKHVLSNKLQQTKRWIQLRRIQEQRERTARLGKEEKLLSGLLGLTKSLVADGAQITEDEQHLLDDVASYLNS